MKKKTQLKNDELDEDDDVNNAADKDDGGTDDAAGDNDDGDLLVGAEEIAKYLRSLGAKKMNRSKVYHAARAGTLPIGSLGKFLISTRRSINRRLARITKS